MTKILPRIPGRTAKERQLNARIITIVAMIYILQASSGGVHFNRRSRAETRYL